MNIAHQTARVRSADVELFYRRLGKRGATPLLIVHGLSYFSWDWLEVAQALGAEREVICMDMRGFGDSEWSAAKDYAVPTMGRDVIAVMDHAGLDRAVIAGHSMGGRSATFAAAKFPERAAGLVLVDYSPENAPAGTRRTAQTVAGTPDAFASIEEALKYFGKGSRERFEAYLKKTPQGLAVKRDPHFRDQFRKMLESGERPKLGVDMWQLIGEVRCPILSLRGARSDMYAPETKEKMRAANAGLRIAEVDAGHNIAGENPQGFLGALRPFLAGLEKSHEHARH
ncbi:MAG TPA: alpha/beta hydrolase [Burkholderiales bacterium]|nr:alpha/beta hydrolase [Burkholderiales bacterium]